MKKLKIILFFLLIVLNASAQNNELEYAKKITISEGLAHNGITSVLEDSNGFLWIGTYDGINKYDGYKLTTYKNTIDSEILTTNRVRAITEDNNKNLWIGTDEGLTILNLSTEKFIKVYSNNLTGKNIGGPIIRKILFNEKDDLMYCATEYEGVLVFDKNFKFIKQIAPNKEAANQMIFYDGIKLSNQDFIFTSSKGLFHLDSKKNLLKRILKKTIKLSRAITKIDDNSFLVTLNTGFSVACYNRGNNTFLNSKVNLKENQFNSAEIDKNNRLWLGTMDNGVLVVDNILSKLNCNLIQDLNYIYFTDKTDRLRISNIVSTDKNVWLSTFNEGLYQFELRKNPFKKYQKEMNDPLGISSNRITSISSLDKSRVFVSATFGGLGLFNTDSQKFEKLPFNISKLTKNRVSSVFVDSNKNVWFKVSGEDGIYRAKKDKRNIEKFPHPLLKTYRGQAFRSFTEDKFGNIWIGTTTDVLKVSIENNEVKRIESLNNNPFFKNNKLSLARHIYADPVKNYIWIGADSDGLFRLEIDKNTEVNKLKITQFVKNKLKESSLPTNFITSVLRLPNNELWIGTEGGGLCKVIEEESQLKFIPFTEKNGLSNNVVKSIVFDNDQSLWVSTNIGLNKFDLKNNTFRTFNLADGLPFEDFLYTSEKLENNIIVLSGLDGFCFFNPKDLLYKEKLPKVYLENLKVFDQVVKQGDTINNRVLIDKSFSSLNKVALKHNENVFSFNLTSLHFSNPKNHFLKYKLEPINSDWVEVSSDNNLINYSGLQPNTYKLSYMVSNSLNEWTQPQNLTIIVTPPFWKTTWAYILYFVLLFLFIYAITYTITKIQSLNHKVAIDKLETESIKELNEAKLRFFSNISHEIKTPITLINSPVGALYERYKNNFDVSEKLGLIKRQTKKISELVDQVHDFRRADANLLKLNYSRFNFNHFIQELTNDFMFLANKDQKNFELVAKDKNIIVSADKKKIEKIINNLISNAFKYTKADDTIKIEFSSDEKDLNIAIIDTGMGIDKDDVEHIFERFYQSQSTLKEHISGSGIGLAFSKKLVEMHYGYISAESKINKGTTINIQLPIVKKQVEEDEVLEKEIKLPKEKEINLDSTFVQQETSTGIEVSGEFSESLIFYAEDNLEMRNYVSDILSKYFKVKVFRDGQECLEALEHTWPDIVISDVQMPVLNGLDLCIAVKSNLKTSHIPVILLTALTNIEDHVKGIRDGADAYIKKPFNVQRLVTNVEALLTNRKQLRERYQVGIPLTKENNKNNRNDNAFLEKLYSIMEENLDNQDFDINTLAKELYLNRTHFYQKVKVLTNQTPFELIKMYRLKKAAQFLVQQKLSVNEVFLMTGFKSRTHFTKIFKEKYNISPSKYANEKENDYT